jgi:hypothetical protein
MIDWRMAQRSDIAMHTPMVLRLAADRPAKSLWGVVVISPFESGFLFS